MSESTRAAAKAMGEVMVAFGDGAEIEYMYRMSIANPPRWYPIDEPNWDWEYCDFRVRKKEEKQP